MPDTPRTQRVGGEEPAAARTRRTRLDSPFQQEAAIGKRIRSARRARGLSQLDLASRIDRSESWIRGLERGRQTLVKHQVAIALADELGVTVGWLYGQPHQPQRPGQDAGHTTIPTLRTALRRTALLLAGHPGVTPIDRPVPLEALTKDVARIVRHRQDANLTALNSRLPDLLEDLNTALVAYQGTAGDHVYRLIVDTAHAARVMCNLLGLHDLAWQATDSAAHAAGRLGDTVAVADSAWNRCGALLHNGELAEVTVVATAALHQLEPSQTSPHAEHLALWGALHLRCAVAAGRAGRVSDADTHLQQAHETAQRLPDGYVDWRHQTVFSGAVVTLHEIEVAVELGDPHRALTRATTFQPAAIGSKERRTRHGINMARAHAAVGHDAATVRELRAAARLSPGYLHNHSMARQVVDGLLMRDRPTARHAGLAELARDMGIR